MIETTIDEIMQKAREINGQGKKWHFHMLTPDCIFNQRDDKQAFVLENRTDKETYVAYSEERHMEQGKTLVSMLHGDSIISDEKMDGQINENIERIISKAKELNERGIHWHHHMFFPDCIFNEHKGKWCIVFEDKETDKTIESVSDEEPKEGLRRIEVLFYNQKK